jgi:hypothetical protein
MGLVDRDDGWRMPDWLWERVEPCCRLRPSIRWELTAGAWRSAR